MMFEQKKPPFITAPFALTVFVALIVLFQIKPQQGSELELGEGEC